MTGTSRALFCYRCCERLRTCQCTRSEHLNAEDDLWHEGQYVLLDDDEEQCQSQAFNCPMLVYDLKAEDEFGHEETYLLHDDEDECIIISPAEEFAAAANQDCLLHYNLHMVLSVQRKYFTQKPQSSIDRWLPSSEAQKRIKNQKFKKESAIALTFSKPDPEMHHWETTKCRFPIPRWEKDKLELRT